MIVWRNKPSRSGAGHDQWVFLQCNRHFPKDNNISEDLDVPLLGHEGGFVLLHQEHWRKTSSGLFILPWFLIPWISLLMKAANKKGLGGWWWPAPFGAEFKETKHGACESVTCSAFRQLRRLVKSSKNKFKKSSFFYLVDSSLSFRT